MLWQDGRWFESQLVQEAGSLPGLVTLLGTGACKSGWTSKGGNAAPVRRGEATVQIRVGGRSGEGTEVAEVLDHGQSGGPSEQRFMQAAVVGQGHVPRIEGRSC